MLQIIMVGLGLVCLIIGIMQIVNPEPPAKKLAEKAGVALDGVPVDEVYLKKAKSNAIALVVASIVVLGIAVGLSVM